MEELLKILVMLTYLEEQNVKDTATIQRIQELRKESGQLRDKMALHFLAEKYSFQITHKAT